MKLSELIARLADALAQHGNLEVWYDGGDGFIEPVNSVIPRMETGMQHVLLTESKPPPPAESQPKVLFRGQA